MEDDYNYHFILGIFDYKKFSKQAVRDNIENGFFDELVKSVEFFADEIVVLFTCLRLEIYIYCRNRKELSEIKKIFLYNNLEIFLTEQEITGHLVELFSGRLSEIIAELQIEKQVNNVFRSQLGRNAKLKNVCKKSLLRAFCFRKKNNFYNKENYATIALKIIEDLTNKESRNLLIVGTGMMSMEFIKACDKEKDRFERIFIAGRDTQKAKRLKNELLSKYQDIKISSIQQINNIVKKVDVIFAAAGGKYEIFKHRNPLLIIDISCPPIFRIEDFSQTKIITIYDEIYVKKINEMNKKFRYK